MFMGIFQTEINLAITSADIEIVLYCYRPVEDVVTLKKFVASRETRMWQGTHISLPMFCVIRTVLFCTYELLVEHQCFLSLWELCYVTSSQ